MKPKDKSLSSLIHEADSVFSEFIRVRDAKPFSGLVHCFICGVAIPWRSSQAMHYIGRSQKGTRYDECNVRAGCEVCNCIDLNHQERFTEKLKQILTPEGFRHLHQKSVSTVKMMRHEYIELIGEYKGRVKELRKQKHI
jgi:hypothetical protein